VRRGAGQVGRALVSLRFRNSKQACMPVRARAHIYARTHTHMHARTHARIHTHAHTHARTHARTHACTCRLGMARSAQEAAAARVEAAAAAEALHARTTVLEGRVRFLECELQVSLESMRLLRCEREELGPQSLRRCAHCTSSCASARLMPHALGWPCFELYEYNVHAVSTVAWACHTQI